MDTQRGMILPALQHATTNWNPVIATQAHVQTIKSASHPTSAAYLSTYLPNSNITSGR
jgi:hypothetical protein